MNCPHCKSSYTEVKHTYEDLDGVTTEYYCSACSRRFTKTVNKSAPEGKLVLEVVDSGNYSGEHDHIAKFYLTSEGMLIIRQKSSNLDSRLNVTGYKFLTLAHMPTFKVSKNRWGASLEYNSFRSLNDSKGTLFSVNGISMYGEFLEKAKSSEAMQIMMKTNCSNKNEAVINDAARFLNSLLSSHPIKQPAPQNSNTTSSSSGGCYIATCVYGSYDCPEVWTLRRFRDNTLGTTWYGRCFIKTYYAISPYLVRWFGEKRWFKRFWKNRLDYMVKGLQSHGVESTEYDDFKW